MTMAVPEDYVGQRFGAFQIGQIIGAGLAGEVFDCLHLVNGRRYALKLPVGDDALWDGEPLLPPRNGRGPGVLVAITKIRLMATSFPSGFQDLTPDYFAVVDNSWVRPLTVAGRVANALPHTELLQYGPDGRLDRALDRSLVYREVVYTILADAQKLTPDAFDSRWGLVCGGDRFADIAARAGQAGAISQSAAESVTLKAAQRPNLMNNRLFWLLVAADADDIPEMTVRATLRCPLFRLNIETVDFAQLVVLKSALDEAGVLADKPSLGMAQGALSRALGWLAEFPFSPADDLEEFSSDGCEPVAADSSYRDGVVLMQHVAEAGIFDSRLVAPQL